jgi:hypothetical protein
VSNFVQLEQQLLAHDFQGTHFSRILLLGQEDLAVAALANLGEYLEVSLTQSSSPLAEIGSLASEVIVEGFIVLILGGGRGRRVLGFELIETVLAGVHVGKEIVVVI